MDQFDNRTATPVDIDLTEAALESLIRQMLDSVKMASSCFIRPTYLVSTYPLPPRRVRRYRLISERDRVELSIPIRSVRPCSHPWKYHWVDKRCLARFRRRSYPMLYGFGLRPLKRKKPV